MLNPNLAYVLGYLCSLSRFWSFLVGTHDSFCRFLEYVKFLVYSIIGSQVSQNYTLIPNIRKYNQF